MAEETLNEYINTLDWTDAAHIEAAHRDIYTYIHTITLDQVSSSSFPGPMTVFYTVRAILRPSLPIPLIPDLLDVLAEVEAIHRTARQSAERALVWNEHYAARAGARLLDPSDIVQITRITDEKRASARHEIFRNIVLECCSLDVRAAWAEGALARIPVRMNHYFAPATVRAAPSARRFHALFDSADHDALRAVGKECTAFMEQSLVREAAGEPPLSVDLAADAARIADLAEGYLKQVEKIVKKLEDIFSQSA